MSEGEQPQQPDATQILKQLYEAIQEARAEIGSLKAENQSLKEAIGKNEKQFSELVAGVAEGFKNRDEIITKLSQNTLAAPQQKGGGMADIIGKIADTVEKAMSGGAGNVLSDMDIEILKQAKQIQVLSLRNAFRALSKDSGIAETAAHVVVDV